MSININRVTIGGTLTRDPEVKFLANGTAVAKFGMAINKRWRDQNGEQKESTVFVEVECWKRTAELVGQYLAKGRQCICEAELAFDQWEDQQSGQKRSKLFVKAHKVHFVPQRDGQGQSSNGQGMPSPQSSPSGQTPMPDTYHDSPPF